MGLGDLTGIGAVANAVGGILDKIIPDKTAAQAAKDALAAQMDNEDFQLQLAQLKINLADAQGNWFQSGWRPALAWACVLAFIYHILLFPIVHQYLPQISDIQENAFSLMMGVLTVLVGARTYDKMKGTDTK